MRSICLKHGTYDELETCKWVIPEEDFEKAINKVMERIKDKKNHTCIKKLIEMETVLTIIKEEFDIG